MRTEATIKHFIGSLNRYFSPETSVVSARSLEIKIMVLYDCNTIIKSCEELATEHTDIEMAFISTLLK